MNQYPTDNTVTCQNCGTHSPAVAVFCPRCGATVAAPQPGPWGAGASPAASQPVYPPPPGYGPPPSYDPAAGYPLDYGFAPLPESSNTLPILLGLGAILLVAVVAVGGFAAYSLGRNAGGAAPLPTVGEQRLQPIVAPVVTTPATLPTNGRTLGNTNAPHTIDIYEDFQCAPCRDFHVDTETKIVSQYVATGKFKLVAHDFLVVDSSFGGNESLAAANECASDQGLFWPFRDWLFANQYAEGSGTFSRDRLETMGQGAEIANRTKFDSCVDNGTHYADIRAAQQTIPSAIDSTPAIVVDGQVLYDFDYATVSEALDKALAAPSPSTSASAPAS